MRAVCERKRRAEDCPPYQVGYRFVAATEVFLFRYFYPLAPDLDLEEEGEEERR